MDECLHVFFYLSVSQVSLQLGHFLPQILQLLLAGVELLPLFSVLPLPLLLQPLDDSLLRIKKRKEKEREEEKEKERMRKREVTAPTVIHSHSISSFYTNNSHIKLYVHGSFDRI